MLSVAFLVAILSCKKDENHAKDFKKDFEQASLKHNEAMDFVLSSIKSKKSISKEQILVDVRESVNEYIDCNAIFFSDLQESSIILNREADRLISFYKRKKSVDEKIVNEHTDFLLNTIQSYSEQLSLVQKELLLEINSVFEKESNPEIIISKLNFIKDVKCLSLPESERNVVYAATTIGVQSVEYWYGNLDKWIFAITNKKGNRESFSEKGWFNWGSVGKNDVAGAIGGAIGGAAAGGVGAGPGALIGGVSGGAGTSATDAVLQVLNHYF